jgi:hypothetical protein
MLFWMPKFANLGLDAQVCKPGQKMDLLCTLTALMRERQPRETHHLEGPCGTWRVRYLPRTLKEHSTYSLELKVWPPTEVWPERRRRPLSSIKAVCHFLAEHGLLAAGTRMTHGEQTEMPLHTPPRCAMEMPRGFKASSGRTTNRSVDWYHHGRLFEVHTGSVFSKAHWHLATSRLSATYVNELRAWHRVDGRLTCADLYADDRLCAVLSYRALPSGALMLLVLASRVDGRGYGSALFEWWRATHPCTPKVAQCVTHEAFWHTRMVADARATALVDEAIATWPAHVERCVDCTPRSCV